MPNASLAAFTDANFATEVLDSAEPVLVDFWAPWCSPCRALEPVIAALAAEYAGKIKMGKLNIDDCPRVPTDFGVLSIPTLLLFKDGHVIGQIVGAVAKPKLDALVKRAL